MTARQRQATQIMNTLQLENQSLQNDLLRAQITSIGKTTNPPMLSYSDPTVIAGQGDSTSGVEYEPHKIVMSPPGSPYREAGVIPEVAYARTPDGGLAPIPSQGHADRAEDNILANIAWSVRNQIVPLFGVGGARPSLKEFPLPPGYYWGWVGTHYKPRKVSPPPHSSRTMLPSFFTTLR